jgi:hypothetical protein
VSLETLNVRCSQQRAKKKCRRNNPGYIPKLLVAVVALRQTPPAFSGRESTDGYRASLRCWMQRYSSQRDEFHLQPDRDAPNALQRKAGMTELEFRLQPSLSP